MSEYFYENGQLNNHSEYAHGEGNGEYRRYYPSGQLKRREKYAAGKRLDGECFGPNGAAIPYFEYYLLPVYSGGDGSPKAITAAVAKQFSYTKEARRAGITGRIILTFSVNTQGGVEDIKVVKGLAPIVDEEAVRAVSALKHFTPARIDGQLSKFSFTIPITLKLQ